MAIRNYVTVTAADWRSPSPTARFLLYEFFGIVTNLVGGWVASRTGVRFTLGESGAGCVSPRHGAQDHGRGTGTVALALPPVSDAGASWASVKGAG